MTTKKNNDNTVSKNINRMINRMNGIKSIFNRKDDDKIETTKKQITEGYNEPSKIIPILATCDVLIVGGGPSGISASISSSRAGSDTILIEKYGCLGGVITTVGMETLGWYRYEGTTDCEGIGIEMENIAEKMGGTIKWPYNDSQCLDADFFKVVADKLIEDNGVRCILHCYGVDVIVEDNIIKGIITESKSGRMAIMAKRIVDCTGDADIIHFSGAKYRVNKTKDRMAVTTVFNCAGVDKKAFLNYTENNKKTYKDWNGNWNQITSEKEKHLRTPYLNLKLKKTDSQDSNNDSESISGSWSSISDAGEATNLNLIHMKGYDCTDVLDITKAEIEGRKKTLQTLNTLKESIPGFENAKLRNFGMTLGTRDSRKIIGEYELTGHDVMNQSKFIDSIGIFPEFVDGYNVLLLPSTGRYFQIPFRCLVPLGVENLLVAGRCVAGDNISHAAMRNMMACTVTGQGAGIASSVSIKEDVFVRNVNIENVQNELLKQGVRIN
jgi:ribulose 1,5-bisphosphate synthetase/thiazole synthase